MVERQKTFLIIVLIGFVGGILYTNLIAIDYLKITGVFSQYYLQAFASSTLEVGTYLPYVLYVRIIPIIILLLVAYSKFNKLGTIICLVWTGFLMGIYMSLCISQIGLKGIMFSVLGVFPHMIFYGVAYLIIIIYANNYPENRWSGIKIVTVVLCMLVGVVLEVQINPSIMRWFIGIM